MELLDLEHFIAVVNEGNLSRASEKLFITQPALSQCISRLETDIGNLLFDRSQRGIVLTETGHAFYRIAGKMLDLKRVFDQDLLSSNKGIVGRVRLGISHYFSNQLLPKVLPRFQERFPQVEVIIHTETSSALERLLSSGELDVIVMVETEPNPLFQANLLFHEQILLAMDPQNSLVRYGEAREPGSYPYMDPKRLQAQSFILSPERTRLHYSAERFFAAEGLTAKLSVVTSSIDTAVRLAAYGGGIAFVPKAFAATSSGDPCPVFFSTAPTLADWKVVIAVHKDVHQSTLINDFIQAFQEFAL